MTTYMCVSGAALAKAGASRSTSIVIDANIDSWINQAESQINAVTRTDFSAGYAALSDAKKLILNDIASSLAAIQVIQYDMGGYTSRAEAEDMINIQRDNALRGLSLIRDKKVSEDWINA